YFFKQFVKELGARPAKTLNRFHDFVQGGSDLLYAFRESIEQLDVPHVRVDGHGELAVSRVFALGLQNRDGFADLVHELVTDQTFLLVVTRFLSFLQRISHRSQSFRWVTI